MAFEGQKYSTVPSRNLIRAEMQMLKFAETACVLANFGEQKEQPVRKTDTVVFRRLDPFNKQPNGVASIDPTTFLLTEGVTPAANTISYTDVPATLQNYGVLFSLSSKAQLMYEDDIPADMQKLTGNTLGYVQEMVAYGKFRAGSNVIYANGSSRAAVNTKINLGRLRLAARTLESNWADRVTQVIKPGPYFNTTAVPPAYVVFCHTDCNADVRDLVGFIPRERYGSSIKPLHDREFGACEEFRFVNSPLFVPYADAGGAPGTTVVSTSGTAADVYPILIIGDAAWGNVSLKGNGKSSISPTYLRPTDKNHANPLGMFGYVGANFWYEAVRLNENWMARLEVAVSAL